jgi:hypothetical protein
MSTNNLSGKRKIALNDCKKIHIQRDYDQALVVRFKTEYPEELENYASENQIVYYSTNLYLFTD